MEKTSIKWKSEDAGPERRRPRAWGAERAACAGSRAGRVHGGQSGQQFWTCVRAEGRGDAHTSGLSLPDGVTPRGAGLEGGCAGRFGCVPWKAC